MVNLPDNVLDGFRRAVHDQLFGHILPFWSGPALDHEHGGWQPWLSNDLRVDRSKPKGLIVNSRILWTFSAAHRFKPDPLYREMAERALEFIVTRFWDEQHGGAFWQLDSEGRVLNDSKKMYGQAFCIYALSEYSLAFSSSTALNRAEELFKLVDRQAYDPEHGGYFEVRQRNWSESADSRLSEKDMDEKKSMNNHLHLLEAFANLYRASKTPLLENRLRELIHLFATRILDPATSHLHHFFDEKWRVRSGTYTFGHDIEASWLLCEAADVLGSEEVARDVRTAALRIAKVVLEEGIDVTGGLCYEGKAGRVIDSGKECWPQAEAVIGFLNAYQLSKDERFFEAAQRVWGFIERYLVDRSHGEWFWRINEDGRPDPNLPKVSEWKGPYHGSRACLETLHRLDEPRHCLSSGHHQFNSHEQNR